MPNEPWTLNGKIVAITGATSGIGQVTARELAKDGATVVLICRSEQKGKETLGMIRSVASGARLDLIVADLGVQAEVRKAADEVLRRFSRLDVLVNNAGAINTKRTTTADGIETTFAVNHLAYFLLTNLLLDRLRQSAPARIISVASRAHTRVNVDLDDVESKKSYNGLRTYARSKLCNVLFTYELARRIEGSGVTANCLHPGVIASGFGRNTPGLFDFGVRLVSRFMWTPEKGATSSLRLARAPELASVSGKYFDEHGRETRSSRVSYDRDAQRKLWEISEKMTRI